MSKQVTIKIDSKRTNPQNQLWCSHQWFFSINSDEWKMKILDDSF